MYMKKSHLAILSTLLLAALTAAPALSQTPDEPNFDGLVAASSFESLTGKPCEVTLVQKGGKSSKLKGNLTDITPGKRGSSDIRLIEVSEGRRKRRVKSEEIQSLWINRRAYLLRYFVPEDQRFLVDKLQMMQAATQRLAKEKAKPMPLERPSNFETMNVASRKYLEAAKDTLAAEQVHVEESPEVLLLTDLPEAQSRGLLAAIGTYTESLNTYFAIEDINLLGPGKPVLAVFLDRQLLVKFETDVIQSNELTESKTQIHDFRNRTIIVVQDERSLKHLTWQTAWGLSGLYVRFAYSDLKPPYWLGAGVQQRAADLLVPNINNQRADLAKTRMLFARQATLAGALDSDELPADQLVLCSSLVGFLQNVSPEGFNQFFEQVKLGLTVDEALLQTYGKNTEDLVLGFGQTIGVPGLRP